MSAELFIPKIPLVYEDADLVVVNKPAGLPSHATLDPKRPHLHQQLESQLGCSLTLHHRLDRDTTGCVLLSKTPELNTALADLFRSRRVEKIYVALVEGQLHSKPWSVSNFLKRRAKNRPEMIQVRSGGDSAQTDFVPLQSKGRFSLIQAKPHTGRTHQIRVHLSLSGCPILGDDLYGGPKGQLMLHAWQLKFKHPRTHEDLVIEAPPPEAWLQKSRSLGFHL